VKHLFFFLAVILQDINLEQNVFAAPQGICKSERDYFAPSQSLDICHQVLSFVDAS
jgi:hypothetical protein